VDNNLEFHNLKRGDVATCEHCGHNHWPTDEIEGMERTVTMRTACRECCDFEAQLHKLNGLIAKTRLELANLVDPDSAAAAKCRELLSVQQQKRNKVIHDAKRFYEGRTNSTNINEAARMPYKE